jgi:phage baseplate assembly protein V
MEPLHETIFDLRGAIGRGIVQATYDSGQAQTVDVEMYDGMIRTGIEVHQTFGLASRAPLDGAVVMLFAVEGDPGHLVALPLANFSVRFGNLADGETVLYGSDGSRVAIRNGGTIQVLAASAIDIAAPNVSILATSGGTVMIAQNAAIAGTLSVAGMLTAGSLAVTGAAMVSGDLTVGGTIHGHLG